MSGFLERLRACSDRAMAVMMISSRVPSPSPAFSKIRMFPSMRAMVLPVFFASTKMTLRVSNLSRFQYQDARFPFASESEVGSNIQCRCRRELLSVVLRPLMCSWISDVLNLWKRIVPTAVLVSLCVTWRRGLLDRKDGRWTASLVMLRMGIRVV